jgi:NADH-ubiquinone oxidoreductase chain 6
MLNLYLLNETFTNGSNHSLLTFVSLASVFCGIFVIISKNPVVSVLFLIGLFLNIASYLMLLGINFIGLSYLLVYVGAVSILFIFILMLINVRISELTTDNTNSIPLAIMIGVFFNFTLHSLLPTNKESASSVYEDSELGNINSIYHPLNIKNIGAVTSSKNDISFVSSPV